MNLNENDLKQQEHPSITAALRESTEDFQQLERFWISQLAGELPVLNLRSRNAHQPDLHTHKASVRYSFPIGIIAELHTFSEQHHLQVFSVLTGALNTLLFRYTRQEDIIVATSHAGLLLLRTKLQKQDTVSQLLRAQQQLWQTAYQHRLPAFEDLHNILHTRSTNWMPEVLVTLDSGLPTAYPTPELWFEFTTGDTLQLTIHYKQSLYDPHFITRIPAHITEVIRSMLQDDNATLKDIPYIPANEVNELLSLHTKIDTPATTIVQMLETQAKHYPDRTAIAFNEHTLSFRELDKRSDQLANYLVSIGILPGSNVLLCFNNGMEHALTGIFGIMKAGAAYVPFDADLPEERISFLFKDTGAAVLITNLTDAASFSVAHPTTILLDDEDSPWHKAPTGKQQQVVSPDSDAYIIYTSGTTGNPKGVIITHHNLVDYFAGLDQKIKISLCHSAALMSTLATDLGNTVLFGAVIYGNTLHLFSKDTLRDVEYIHQYFSKHDIGCIKIVPTYWKALEYKDHLLLPQKMIIFGGEQLLYDNVEKIRKAAPGLRIINHYGPTETTIGKLLHEVTSGPYNNIIPIGQTFSNTNVFIVDEDLNLCAKGIWGELIIGGEGLFKAYMNQPALSADKCIAINDRRLYRTGDQVRLNENGEIEFGFRADKQLKVQGFRIEPDGIETTILQFPTVRQCYVGAIENEHREKILTAYIQTIDGYTETALRTWLKKHLPAYMIPVFLIQVPAIPTTSNGKVDTKSLPSIGQARSAAVYEAPHTALQKLVVGILEGLLNKEQISLTDNYYELGGDSIKSIQVASRLRQKGYKLLLKDIIRYPIIKDFIAQVKISENTVTREDITTGTIPLNAVQQLFFTKKTGNYHHYNQAVTLHGQDLNQHPLKQAFDDLLKFHDTLRIRYRQTAEGDWEQHYDTLQPLTLDVIPYTNALYNDKVRQMGESMNITTGPMIAACLFKGETEDLLYIVIHHLLTDGVSFRILIEDLSNLYYKYTHGSAFKLANKSSSLKEWMNRLTAFVPKPALQSQLPYWQKVISSPSESIVSQPPISNKIADRDILTFTIPAEATSDLLTRCYRQYNTEINEILITATCHAMRDTFQITRLLLNLEGHGREDMGLETDVTRTMGWFTSIFPVYFDTSGSEEHITNLLTVKQVLNDIPTKGMGYSLLHYLGKAKLDVNPEIIFNYLGDFSAGLNTDKHIFQNVQFTYQDADPITACKELMAFTGVIADNQLCMNISFNRHVFTPAKINALGESFCSHLRSLIEKIALA